LTPARQLDLAKCHVYSQSGCNVTLHLFQVFSLKPYKTFTSLKYLSVLQRGSFVLYWCAAFLPTSKIAAFLTIFRRHFGKKT